MAQHTYFLLKHAGEPDRLLVWDTRTLPVGRSSENALVLEESGVSRKHAIFTKDGDRCQVGDYQTGNGTLLNGERVSGTRPIHHGDTITIGKLELMFCETQEHPAKRGVKLEYASHLMTAGMVPQSGNPDSTMVGIDSASADDDDEFIIEHDEDTGSDLFGDGPLELDTGAPAGSVRDLDLAFDAEDPGPAAAAPTAPPAPAPAPPQDSNDSTQTDPLERMRRLKSLHAEGLITDAEFEQKRAQILKDV